MKWLLPATIIAYTVFLIFIIHLVNSPWWR